MYTKTWSEGAMKTESGSFQRCPLTGPESIGTNRNTGDSLWTSGNTLPHEGDCALAQVTWGGCGVSKPGDIQKLSRHGQLGLADLARAGVMDQTTSNLNYSVILWKTTYQSAFYAQKLQDLHICNHTLDLCLCFCHQLYHLWRNSNSFSLPPYHTWSNYDFFLLTLLSIWKSTFCSHSLEKVVISDLWRKGRCNVYCSLLFI